MGGAHAPTSTAAALTRHPRRLHPRPRPASLVGKYLRDAFPRAKITTRNGALPATPSALMNMCLETYVDPGGRGRGVGGWAWASLCHWQRPGTPAAVAGFRRSGKQPRPGPAAHPRPRPAAPRPPQRWTFSLWSTAPTTAPTREARGRGQRLRGCRAPVSARAAARRCCDCGRPTPSHQPPLFLNGPPLNPPATTWSSPRCTSACCARS
jgi:hypothetical protein